MLQYKYGALFLFCGMLASTANGQVTDVAQQVAAALNGYGPVPVTVTVTVLDHYELRCEPHGGDCNNFPVYKQVPQTTSHVLSASNIRVVNSSPVSWGAAQHTDIPGKLFANSQLVNNCSSVPVTQTISLSQSFQQSASLSISQSVTHTVGGSISLTDKITDAFSIGGTITTSMSTTSGSVSVTSSQTTITQSQTGQVTVQPKTALVEQIQVWPVEYTVPFTATVTVDADIGQNDRFTALSQVLSQSSRTFQIAGTVTADNASQAQLIPYDTKFDPSLCPPNNADKPLFQAPFIPKKSQKLMKKSD